MRCRKWLCPPLLTGVLALVGCGETDKWTADRPKPFPAQATVLLDKHPVEGATVVFQPDGAGTRAAAGVTDSAGVVHLQTYEPKDGAVAGKFKVAITKVKVTSTAKSEETQVNDTTSSKTEYLVPKKYGMAATSGLTADVTDGGENKFSFDLQK